MRTILKLLSESALFSIHALAMNKLRTMLSLLGVTFGIFSIVSVFTLVDSFERSIRSSISTLGDNVVFIQKWPWAFGSDYPWWKYINRPVPSLEELKVINERCNSAESAALMLEVRKSVSRGNSTMDAVRIVAASRDYNKVRSFELLNGRYFTEGESKGGYPVAIIGADVALGLFGAVNPVGQDVKILGRKLKVVGVFSREGESMVGNSTDNMVLCPVNYARTIVSLKSRFVEPWIMVKAKDGVSNVQLKDELMGLMRTTRRLQPKQDDNFALNETSLLSQGLEGFFGGINLAGFVIGIFSIIVGGFGIANIMFVSVKERTTIIGVQKALGAKRFVILMQFLTEAVVLCLLGGVVGLVLIFLLTLLIQAVSDFDIYMSITNIMTGILMSIFIGLIAGIIPAWRAALMNPVEAIRAN